MSSPELSLFSFEVMGLVGRAGAGPHDLLRMARRARVLDWAGESPYYVEPKRLARLGYLQARSEPGRTRPRTVYTLTEKGLEALRDFAATPVRITPLKSEPLLRLLLADLVGESITRASMGTLRDDIADPVAQLDENVAAARALPHRSKYLLLVHGLPASRSRALPRARRRGRARVRRVISLWGARPGDWAISERGGEPFGIDAAGTLIDLARRRVPNADLRIGEMERLPYDDASFDLFTGFNSFFYADDIVAALREARRVATRGGAVVIRV